MAFLQGAPDSGVPRVDPSTVDPEEGTVPIPGSAQEMVASQTGGIDYSSHEGQLPDDHSGSGWARERPN